MNKKEFVFVTGLATGEETKGACVEWLANQLNAHTIWRKGGWQAGHFIVTGDGREQMFSHFSSGTFNRVPTYLNQMVISPADLFEEAMQIEGKGVANPLSLITLDESCLVTTPYHGAISRFREIMRGDDKKGTVGKGVGDALRDADDPTISIRVREFREEERALLAKVEAIRLRKLEQAQEIVSQIGKGQVTTEAEAELAVLGDKEIGPLVVQSFKYLADLVEITDERYLSELLQRRGVMVCESSHGTLLDARWGYAPYGTQVDPTPGPVATLLDRHLYQGERVHLGVSRCYLTRHGGKAPFVSYSPELTRSIGETHNSASSDWYGEFQNGFYDSVALNYSLKVSGRQQPVNGLMISYLDKLADKSEWPVCESYQYKGNQKNLEDYFEIQNGLIIGIKFNPSKDEKARYQHQLELTQLLKQCEPILKVLIPEKGKTLEEVFLGYVEEKLGLPVVAVARGPLASDRSFRESWEKMLCRDIR
ncbi:adenylosuccinate synthetase [Patescibacteria group bacterium]|nr:adenylosuccinate synthetase [Patescibacteria group bacterium]